MANDPVSSTIGMLSLLEKAQQLDPSYQIQEQSKIGDILNKIGATKLYRKKLQSMMGMKTDPSIPSHPILGSPTETGRYSGDWFDYTTAYDQGGQPIPRGGIKGIVQAIAETAAPEWAGKRAAFQSGLKDLEKLVFEFGGKAVTGTEKPTVAATFPTQFDDEAIFKAKYEQDIKKNIPSFLEQQAQNLIDMGFDEAGAQELIRSALEDIGAEGGK